jgi:protein tyrosine phosphatase (PTP) superfamily phosphohydrolase (DUF442 family)
MIRFPCTVVLALAACARPGAAPHDASASAVYAARIARPGITESRPAELPGLHNVVAYTDRCMSGAQPDGEQAFAALAAMGVRTVISVDGAPPDVELAHRYGLRYVHLPISYDDVPAERGLQIAQALHALPGPFYVHCHHGKHRSAAALGSAAVIAGAITPDQAAARMKVSGLSKDYRGLWEAVATSAPAAAAALRADPASFPSRASVSGLVATMAAIDLVFDNLKVVSKTQWRPTESHPDLVPAREAKRLAELVRGLRDDAESKAHPADYQDLLATMIAAAEQLEAAVQAGDVDQATAQFDRAGKSCKQCHVSYRDQ